MRCDSSTQPAKSTILHRSLQNGRQRFSVDQAIKVPQLGHLIFLLISRCLEYAPSQFKLNVVAGLKCASRHRSYKEPDGKAVTAAADLRKVR